MDKIPDEKLHQALHPFKFQALVLFSSARIRIINYPSPLASLTIAIQQHFHHFSPKQVTSPQ